ncbi:MAG: POTRA domain-containing protein [Bacteroidia bacterium]
MKHLAGTLLLWLFCIALQAQSFTLEIQKADSTELPIKIKNAYSSETALKNGLSELINNLHDEGYLAASLDSGVLKGKKYTAWIYAGPQFKWAELYPLEADGGALGFAGYRERLYRNRPIRLKATQRMMRKIVGFYENHGYPFASVKFDSLEINEGVVKAGIRVFKGELIKIDSVTIRGDAKIAEKYLYNYIGIKPGDLYNESIIQTIDTRVKELPFLSQQRPAEVFLLDEVALIRLYLKNKKASSFNGIVGFLPNNDKTGKLLITGEANLRLKNAVGKGESIVAEWRRLQTQTQSLNIQLAWPFLLNTRIGADGQLGLYKRDTTFLNVNTGLGIQYLMKGTDYLKVFFENKRSSLLSTRGLENLLTLPDYADTRSGQYGLELSLTRLDYRINPRKGYKILMRGGAGNRIIEKNAGLNAQVYEGLSLKTIQFTGFLDADFYFPIRSRSVFTPGLLCGVVGGRSIFENELQRIGGNNTLRGFDEESIFSSAYSILNLEYRYLLEENSFLFLFCNGAYYENTAINRSIHDLPYGFGAGMSFETKAGIFSISYALGSQFGNPPETRTAKVHFGITSLF